MAAGKIAHLSIDEGKAMGRGTSSAKIMAADLAVTPVDGLEDQLCGDAYLRTSARSLRPSLGLTPVWGMSSPA